MTDTNAPNARNDTILFNDTLGSTYATVDDGKCSSITRTQFGMSDNKSKTEDFFTGKPYVEGLGYVFLNRNYRPELAKWKSSDPMGYPDGWNNTSYVNNLVTYAVDWSGTIIYIPDDDPIFEAQVKAAIEIIRDTTTGAAMLADLEGSSYTHEIMYTKFDNMCIGTNSYPATTILYNPTTTSADGWSCPSWSVLAHELVHAWRSDQGTQDDSIHEGIPVEEIVACCKTNLMLKENNPNASMRTHYGAKLPDKAINPTPGGDCLAE